MDGQTSTTGTLDTVLHSTPSMNRKALRKARKSAAKKAEDIMVCVANYQDAWVEEKSPFIEPRPTEDTIKYECCICGDELVFSEGVAHCTEHFMCNDCVVDAYNAALADAEAFPAQCCTPLPHRLVEHLLSSEVYEAYSLKVQEYYTPRAIRVYCVNEHCRSFIPKSCIDDSYDLSTVACCGCGIYTCVGCKSEWQGEEHRCTDSDEPGVRPKWLPEYSSTCRAKSCPNCRVWMEHKEACNHMTCYYCGHEFCFVCLQPWANEGFHEYDGCPSYGDPVEGYDEEGYELGRRGIHRDTGYNRAGLDRFGREKLSHAVAEGNPANEDGAHWDPDDLNLDEHDAEFDNDENPDLDDYDYDVGANVDYGDGEGWGDIEQANPELVSVGWVIEPATTDSEMGAAPDEAFPVAFRNQADAIEATSVPSSDSAPVTRRRSRASPPSDSIRQRIRLSRRVPILAPNPHPDNSVFNDGNPTFQQLECNHSWQEQMLYETEYRYALCRGCSYTANRWTNFCSTCGLIACDWCSNSFQGRFVAEWECEASLVTILVWAEKGVVPYKTQRRRASEQRKDKLWADCDEDGLGLATMMEIYETRLFELQPYLYWDFGTQFMFEELELEMKKEYWAVTEENVGVSGLTFTFNLATNPFTPLYWNEEI